MTLVLTCLTNDYILQVADRRVTLADGTLKDDDTTKAVFYCGHFAVSFTGPDAMDDKPTAEWIAWCMKDAPNIMEAMRSIARRAEDSYRGKLVYKFAVVAAGWVTLRGTNQPLPHLSVASNFINNHGQWQSSPSERMTIVANFPLKNLPYFFFAAGQNLTGQEEARLKNGISRAIKSKTPAMSLAYVLTETIQGIARGNDERSKRVGKGMIIHLLPRKIAEIKNNPVFLLCGLSDDAYSFDYVSSEGRRDPLKGAVLACSGTVRTDFECGSLPRRNS
jgi:hypothetical protein